MDYMMLADLKENLVQQVDLQDLKASQELEEFTH